MNAAKAFAGEAVGCRHPVFVSQGRHRDWVDDEMTADVWFTEPSGLLAARAGKFRLTVQKIEGGACFTVQVSRRGCGDPDPAYVVIASGDRETVREAMKAASRTVIKLRPSTGE